MAKNKKKKTSTKASSCGSCYWLWRGSLSKGFWTPLELGCSFGCVPSAPLRKGRRKFEVIRKGCRSIFPSWFKLDILPDCSMSECEWIAVENSQGELVWEEFENRCDGGCKRVEPSEPPQEEGELYLEICIPEEVAEIKRKKKYKKKWKKLLKQYKCSCK